MELQTNDLKALRKRLEMTQDELATALGVSRKAINELEAKEVPDRRTILAVRQLLDESGRKKALEIARTYGGIDGAHHKDWVIDQMVRALTGDEYDAFVKAACAGEDGPDTYSWSEGIAP